MRVVLGCVPIGCTEEEGTQEWVVSLTKMTLNKVALRAGESVYQDAKDSPCYARDGERNSTMWIKA